MAHQIVMSIMTKPAAEALITHHIHDAYEGIDRGDINIAEFSLQDIYGIMEKLNRPLFEKMSKAYSSQICEAQIDVNMLSDEIALKSNDHVDIDLVPYDIANEIAIDLYDMLLPYATKLEISGEIRRSKNLVHTIDIVGRFDSNIDVIRKIHKLDPHEWGGAYRRFGFYDGMNFRIWMAQTLVEYPMMILLSTGPIEYINKLKKIAEKRGIKLQMGGLHKRPNIKKEEDIFRFLGIDYVEPESRK